MKVGIAVAVEVGVVDEVNVVVAEVDFAVVPEMPAAFYSLQI